MVTALQQQKKDVKMLMEKEKSDQRSAAINTISHSWQTTHSYERVLCYMKIRKLGVRSWGGGYQSAQNRIIVVTRPNVSETDRWEMYVMKEKAEHLQRESGGRKEYYKDGEG